MRSYFIQIPQWVRLIYPQAIWDVEDVDKSQYPAIMDHDKLQITIDDGPHPKSTPLWLDWLEARGIKATFFVLADRAKKYNSIIRQIRARGHQVGSHGIGHKDGWQTNKLEYVQDAVQSLDSLETKLYRPPYGRMTPAQYRSLKEHCDIVMWSLMPGDFDPAISAHQVSQRLSLAKLTDIVVLHDTPTCYYKVAGAEREWPLRDRLSDPIF